LLGGCIEGPVYQREDLPGIVLRPSEGLPGTAPDERGPESLDELTPYFGDLDEAGFVAAYGTSLGHEGVLSGDVEAGSLPGNEVRGVQSTAILFEGAGGADLVLDAQREALPNGPFEIRAWLPADGLGEEGFGARARSPQDVTSTLFQWRRGNLLLVLNVFGEFAIPQVRSLAETMERRAREALVT
jgi:hypothetical protein